MTCYISKSALGKFGMMNEYQNCRICGNDNLGIIFDGKIRDGSYGNLSSSNYKVFQCSKCSIRFLDKFASPELYESEEYREKYCDSKQLEDYRTAHDELWNHKLHRIGIHNCRNKSIADFGAGGGSFLDALQGFAKKTIAIEPTQHWHEEMSNKHRVFSYGKELVATGIKVDIGVSFDVIEHVPDPQTYLREIHDSLIKTGKIFLMTPNSKEILFDLAKENFEPFYFRTAHSYYFCEDSIKFLLKRVGFKKLKIGYFHEMDVSNLIFWLKNGKPTGKNKNKLFDDEANRYFCSYLEKIGKSSHLWVEAEK
jgi:2-polyprenyl-3-methyl-5-hydroxy-6-metoxy-1,4-benzoquinol methylase